MAAACCPPSSLLNKKKEENAVFVAWSVFSFVPLSFTAMKHLDMGSLSFLAAVAMPIMEATSKVNRRMQKVNNGWHCFQSSVETPWTLYSCSGSQRMQSVREGFFFVFVCCGLRLLFHALLCDETYYCVTELPPYGPRLQDSSDRNTAAMISVVRRRHQYNAVYLHFSRCPNFLPLFFFLSLFI